MKLQTPVEVKRGGISISLSDKTMVLGSCFADSIGEKMVHAGFDVCVNPFGTLYNPVSIANSISRLCSDLPFTEAECVEMGAGAGLVCSFSHHSSFARATSEEFLADANKSFEDACAFWRRCNKVIISLGTIFCYVHGGQVVSNCLKRPSQEFQKQEMTLEQVSAVLSHIVINSPDKEFIFTVSPIRHMADGAHLNQISKSTLLLGVDSLIRDTVSGPRCEYFPAYEILLDELRDYRFYADDMVHPSSLATAIIWERFQDFAVPQECLPGIAANEKAWRQSQHRPIH